MQLFVFVFFINGKTFYDKTGAKKLLVVGREITEIKSAEQKIKDSEEKYRTLFESSKDGIAMTTLDGYITDCNPAFLDMVGYSMEEIKNLTYNDQFLTYSKTDQEILLFLPLFL